MAIEPLSHSAIPGGSPSSGEVSQPERLRNRTKQFAVRLVRLCRSLPGTAEARLVGGQLLRSGTSVAANYRAVCRARSRAEFAAKLGVVVEEADETAFWLEFLADAGIIRRDRLAAVLEEANELVAIFAAAQRTARRAKPRNDAMAK